MLAVQLDGREVETVESLGEDEGLSPLQQAFKDAHALQCGFCTPGLPDDGDGACARGSRALQRDEIRDELSGVLCRCTGYEGIVDAVERHLGGEGDD